MKKLFRSCTALLLALCLVLGLGAVAASAAEPEGLTEQDLVEWAEGVLAELQAVDLREDLTAENLTKLVREVIAEVNANIAELEVYLAEKEVELEETVAEAETQIADAKAKIEEAKEARDQLEEAYELIAEAETKLAEAKAELEEKKAEIGDDAGRIQEIRDAEAELAKKEAELKEKKAELAEKEAELVDALEEMGVEVAEDDDLLEVLDHKIAEAETEIAEAEEILDTAVPAVQIAIDELQAAIKEAKKAVAELAPYAEKTAEESQPVLDAMFAVYDALEVLFGQGANAAALELQSALYELATTSYELVKSVTGKSSERLEKFVAEKKAELDQMFRDATQAELDCIELSKIVALGDKNAYGPAADMLGDKAAEFLGAECVTYKNMTVAGQTAAQLHANLDKYAAELKDATVITLSFNTNAFSKYAFDKVVSNTGCNWAQYIGEENVDIIENARAELYAMLEDNGLENINSVILMAEAYAYAYIQHLVSYYPLVQDIHAMNPDAYIVMVGMHNPVEGFSTEVGGVELPLGDFMRYLTDISNIYSLSYAMLSENKLYVDAFNIEVGNEGAYYEHVPTQDGYAEIAENIWEALGVHDHDWKLVDITDEGEWYECQVCGAKKFVPVEHNPDDGDMIGVVIALLAVSGMGITVLKRREN